MLGDLLFTGGSDRGAYRAHQHDGIHPLAIQHFADPDPLAPNLATAIALLLVRSALSLMDVPTRTSYVMAVVTPPERPAAASITAAPKTFAWAAGSMIRATC
jgi:hypothetical protein